jgi:alkanesulfonate monooxygenase SsuD/methylene tetrahydromethanopterin reductase-like flavin-dependent oxidoreductase (luciferase family)
MLDRLGVYICPWGRSGSSAAGLVDLAVEAEQLGFDSVSVGWHFTVPPDPMHNSRFNLDALVMLPIIAARTSTIRLGIHSLVAPCMSPFASANYLASLDVASGGRLIAGAAVGWWDEDFRAAGVPLRERGARTNESLDVMTKLWRGEEIAVPGRFGDFTGLAIDPRPVQDPLPLWIGGGAKSIERAARWGTALLPVALTAEHVRMQLKPALAQASESHGRPIELGVLTYAVVGDDAASDPETLRGLEGLLPGNGSGAATRPEDCMIVGRPEACAQQLTSLLTAGVDYVVVNFSLHGAATQDFARQQMRRFANDVVPLLA